MSFFSSAAGRLKGAPAPAAIGRDQESRAERFFLARGWRLLERNFRSPWGEIDLIFVDACGRVVFVEVKYRSEAAHGRPQEFVGREKQRRILNTALAYIKRRGLEGRDFRFDVAALDPDGVEHIAHAFSPQGLTL